MTDQPQPDTSHSPSLPRGYAPPQITVLGTLAELTRGTPMANKTDGALGPGSH